MHFFLTSYFPLTAFNASLEAYRLRLNQAISYQTFTFSDWNIAIWNRERDNDRYYSDFSVFDNDWFCICADNHKDRVNRRDNGDYCKHLFEQDKRNQLISFLEKSELVGSCAILKLQSDEVYLWSSRSQFKPLLYSMTDNLENRAHHLTITSDILLAMHYNVSALNTVPSDHLLQIDLENNEITKILSLMERPRRESHSNDYLNIGTRLLESSKHSIERYLGEISFDKQTDLLIIEEDGIHWSSLLLKCAVAQLSLQPQIQTVQPVAHSTFQYSPELNAVLGEFLSSF